MTGKAALLKYLEVSALANSLGGEPQVSLILLKIRRTFDEGTDTPILRATAAALVRKDLEAVRASYEPGAPKTIDLREQCQDYLGEPT